MGSLAHKNTEIDGLLGVEGTELDCLFGVQKN